MSIAADLLQELKDESQSARRLLERVPDDKFDWQPHEKSMPLGDLANHLATISFWAKMTVQHDSLDIAPTDGSLPRPPHAANRAELVKLLDDNLTVAEEALSAADADDAAMGEEWTLLKGGNKILSLPRALVVRKFVLNHLIHHRAQLGVYLRLLEIPVPATMGPSADENIFG